MKNIIAAFLCLLLLTILTSTILQKHLPITNSINSVIGNLSYVSKFGHEPATDASDFERITTHLRYVEDLLRNKDVSDLEPIRLVNRNSLLDHLNDYTTAGTFPVNYDHDGRRPCFIDKDGNICAVGYLVEKTLGREAAETINNNYKYSYISEIKSEILDQWIGNSGLTENEIAMIQPTYGYTGREKENVINAATIAFSSANIVLSVFNCKEIRHKKSGYAFPLFGIMTSIAQFTFTYLNQQDNSRHLKDFPQLVAINYGISVTTFVISIVNIMTAKFYDSRREKKTDLKFYSHPDKNNNLNLGVAFKHTF